MRLEGTVVLTVVEGGLSPDPQTVASTLEARVDAVLDEAVEGIDRWEAIAHVARLEEFLERECAADEIQAQLLFVKGIKWEREMLDKVLAGASYGYGGEGSEFVDKGCSLIPVYRADYERQLAENRRIYAEARRRMG